MAGIEEARRHYDELCAQWRKVSDRARARRRAITFEFARCAAGQGVGPTIQAINEVESLEAREQELRKAMNELLRQTFG